MPKFLQGIYDQERELIDQYQVAHWKDYCAGVPEIIDTPRNYLYFNLTPRSVQEYLKYCPNRAARKKVYQAYQELHTGPAAAPLRHVLQEVLRARQARAALAGYEHYFQFRSAQRLEPDLARIKKFLDARLARHLPKVENYHKALGHFARTALGYKKLNPWDRSFVKQKYTREHLGHDEGQWREYFPLSVVLPRTFKFLEKLFAIKLVAASQKSSRSSHGAYIVTHPSGAPPLGYLALKLAEDHGNYNCRMGLIGEFEYRGERHKLPTAYVEGGFSKSTKAGEVFLGLSDLATLFHELGHALESIFSGSELSASEVDIREVSSSFMENFIGEYAVVKELSQHYETARAITPAQFAAARKYYQLEALADEISQIHIAWLDLYFTTGGEDNLTRCAQRLAAKTQINKLHNFNILAHRHLLCPCDNNTTTANFYHYAFCAAIAENLYKKFKAKPSGINLTLGKKFKNKFLGQIGNRPFAQCYADFMGEKIRCPDP